MSHPAASENEFRLGWPVVLAAALGIGLGLSPVPFYTIGMFAPELAKEFGWGFGEMMFGITVQTLVVLVLSPVVGHLADRFGVRKVALLSVVGFSLGFGLFAFGNGSIYLFYATWGIMAAAGAGTLPITWTRAVNVWFERKKGLALGISLIGTGVFGALIKPLTAFLIESIGWRGAYVVVAALPLAIAFPVAWFCFRESPEAAGIERAPNPERDRLATTGMSLAEAIRDRRFWIIMLAMVPIAFAIGGPIPNIENILSTNGFDVHAIASLVPLIGISVLCGRMLGGWLIDHFWAPGVAFCLLSLPVFSCWFLASGDLTHTTAAFAIIMIGFAAGVEYDLLAFLVARYFGMASYSTIYGCVYSAFGVGAGFAPTIFGMVFDRTGSYSSILYVTMFVLFLGALLLLGLGRYRYSMAEPEHEKVEEALADSA